MSLEGHAVRFRAPLPGTLPVIWRVTTWCGRELEGPHLAPGASAPEVACEACRAAQDAHRAASLYEARGRL